MPALTSSWRWALVALLCGVIGVQWCRDAAADAERQAALLAADSLRQRSDSLTRQHTADSLAVAQVTEHLADSLAHLDRRLRAARAQTGQLAAALLARPDTLLPRAAVEIVLASKDSLIVLQAEKIITLESDTAAWRQRWLRSEREREAWHQLALEAQTQLVAANKRSAPQRWGCTIGPTAMLGLTGASGFGGGVTCGLHIGRQR